LSRRDGALARMRPDLGIGALAPRRAASSGWRQPGSLAHSRRLGDNAGMARDDNGDRLLRRLLLISHLDGTRPSGTLEWVSPVTPVVTQAAVGAGHWAVGRKARAGYFQEFLENAKNRDSAHAPRLVWDAYGENTSGRRS
jgi:hypothetical protein